MPPDNSYLMIGKTLTALKRNCLDLLETLVGDEDFTYSITQKEGYLFGRKIYLEGVNDARAETKIRGMTLQGAYCDEVTLYTEDFFSMLLSRLSEHGAKLFGTTNPDNPFHWFKVNYLDRADELDMYEIEFLIDENTFLDKHYVEELKKESFCGRKETAMGNILALESEAVPLIEVPDEKRKRYGQILDVLAEKFVSEIFLK